MASESAFSLIKSALDKFRERSQALLQVASSAAVNSPPTPSPQRFLRQKELDEMRDPPPADTISAVENDSPPFDLDAISARAEFEDSARYQESWIDETGHLVELSALYETVGDSTREFSFSASPSHAIGTAHVTLCNQTTSHSNLFFFTVDETRYVEETNVQSDDEFEAPPGVVSRFYLKQNLAAGPEEEIAYESQQQQQQTQQSVMSNKQKTTDWVILTERADDGSGRTISERRFPLLLDSGTPRIRHVALFASPLQLRIIGSDVFTGMAEIDAMYPPPEEEEDDCDNDVISRKEEVEFCNKRARSSALKLHNRLQFAVFSKCLQNDAIPACFKDVKEEDFCVDELTPAELNMTLRSLSCPARIIDHARNRTEAIRLALTTAAAREE
eukprot:TRINITY_DN4835_c0_g1_i2.p1 TRINITY_DN4835_c0_g1~~TRINITY_DN4835_c0_g1_i2.p1  ORF type:complete len:398 (+),score=66.69 TRINITY_DN4835_c0_g1_i2:32-1195(+)